MTNLINKIQSIVRALVRPYVCSHLEACEFAHEVMGVESTCCIQLVGYTFDLVSYHDGEDHALIVITPEQNRRMDEQMEEDLQNTHLRNMECLRAYSSELEATIMAKDEEIKSLKALLAEQK